MSAQSLRAALAMLADTLEHPNATEANRGVHIAAMMQVDDIEKMCRSFKAMGVGAFRDIEPESCETLDALAKDDIP